MFISRTSGGWLSSSSFATTANFLFSSQHGNAIVRQTLAYNHRLIQNNGRCWQRRGLLTHVLEPSVVALGGQRHDDMAVIERPYTIILAQDDGFYQDDWHDLFSQSLVNEHGLSYARFSISQPSSSSSSELSLDAILQEMGRDLAPIPAPIWISRGPVMSWLAQFYLESLPLAGLVMVDPMPLDDTAAVRRMETIFRRSEEQQQQQSQSLVSSSSTLLSHRILKEYVEHWDHWTLRLEPGSVPMLVLSTLYNDADFVRGAQHTVRRHSIQNSSKSGGDDGTGGEGDIRLVPLNGPTSDKVEQQAIMEIVNWIDEHVH